MDRVMIVTGGTGGHIAPAIAIAQELRDREIPHEMVIVGPKVNFRSVEEFRPKIYRGRGRMSIFNALFRIWRRVSRADKIVALGSYASFPALLWARLMGKEYYLVELNAIPGRVTRMFASGAKAVFLEFEEARKYLKGNLIYTGGPVRRYEKMTKQQAREILKIPRNRKVVLIVGGSQGARRLVLSGIELARELKDYEFVIIAGRLYRYVWNKIEIPKNAKVFQFFEDMSLVYIASDVAIARAGGSTIAELLHFRIPALYIPYPYAKDDHQYHNALSVVNRGGGLLLEEKHFSIDVLKKMTIELIDRREEFKKSIMKMRVEDATSKIVDYVVSEGA